MSTITVDFSVLSDGPLPAPFSVAYDTAHQAGDITVVSGMAVGAATNPANRSDIYASYIATVGVDQFSELIIEGMTGVATLEAWCRFVFTTVPVSGYQLQQLGNNFSVRKYVGGSVATTYAGGLSQTFNVGEAMRLTITDTGGGNAHGSCTLDGVEFFQFDDTSGSACTGGYPSFCVVSLPTAGSASTSLWRGGDFAGGAFKAAWAGGSNSLISQGEAR